MEISLRGKKRCIRLYAFFNYVQKTHFVKKNYVDGLVVEGHKHEQIYV